MIIGVGTNLPEIIERLNKAATFSLEERKEDMFVADTVAGVQYKEGELRKCRKDISKDFEKFDNNKVNKYLQDNINIGAQYNKNGQGILDTLARYQQMPKGPLVCIDMAKHPIELTAPDVHPFNSVPYSARSKAREFKTSEVDNILPMHVLEPTHS